MIAPNLIKPTISKKYLLISTLFLLLVSSFLYSAYIFTQGIREDALIINITGSLRYRSFETAWLVRQMNMTREPEARVAWQKHLKHDIQIFDNIISRIEKIGFREEWRKKIEPLRTDTIETWNKIMKPMLYEMSESPDSRAPILIKKYDLIVYDHVEQLNRLVDLIQKQNEDKIRLFDLYRLVFVTLLIILSMGTFFYIRKYFVKPVLELKEKTGKIEDRDFDQRITIKNRDEIGDLANSFNNMAESLQKSFSALEMSSRELLSLGKASNDMVEIQTTENLYNFICEHVRDVFDIKMAWIGIIKEGDYKVYPMASAGFEAGYLENINVTYDDSPTGNGPGGMCIKTRKPFLLTVDDSRFATWREEAQKRGYKSNLGVPLLIGEKCIGELALYSNELDFFDHRRTELMQIFSNHAASVIENSRFLEYIIFALARASEANDEDTGNHILRVGEYCATIARHIGMSDVFANIIKVQATLHDVGKIHVSPAILKKQGKLTDSEWVEMKKHTQAGMKIIGEHIMLNMAKNIALCHHERWDGSGYPQGLKKEQIPIEARIINIADQYDALRSHRPYKPAWDHDKTSKIIIEGDGRTMPHHFDPLVYNAFKDRAAEFEEIYEKLK